jgi:hypothetical protein
MKRRTKIGVATLVLALAAAGAAGAARLGVLTVKVGAAAPASGIKVHGKWSLTVRDKHGHVVARRRFENALTTTGADALDELILGGVCAYQTTCDGEAGGVVGGQEVTLDDGSTAGHGCNATPFYTPCTLVHLNYKSGDDWIAHGAGSGALGVHLNGTAITMNGIVVAPASTTITKVESLLKLCRSQSVDYVNDSNSDCAAETTYFQWREFTAKNITPLAVQPGQVITVSFTLSFS